MSFLKDLQVDGYLVVTGNQARAMAGPQARAMAIGAGSLKWLNDLDIIHTYGFQRQFAHGNLARDFPGHRTIWGNVGGSLID